MLSRAATDVSGNGAHRPRRRLEHIVMFLCMHSNTKKKLKAQPLSRLDLKLAEEEHEQQADNLNQLFVTQLKLNCQLKHGFNLA